jgi:hypothetical protein
MDPSSLRIPDAIEPLVGFRCWYYSIDARGASLFPLNHFVMDPSGRSQWEGAESRWVVARCLGPFSRSHLRLVGACVCGLAVELGVPEDECPMCGRPPHEVPGEACRCGFYAMRALSPELIETVDGSGHWDLAGAVLGRVLLAGKVIEHTGGYRAERARVAELIPISGTEPSVMRLANRLRLPMGLAI